MTPPAPQPVHAEPRPTRGTRRAFFWLGGAALAAVAVGLKLRAQSMPAGGAPASAARSAVVSQDPIAHLLKRIAGGEVTLTGADSDILRAVLRELKIPVESQLLVFSRTSMQAGLIRPSHPRALYFSDSAYVGWVPGGLIEAIAIDPAKGPVFYAFDPQDARDARRTFVRETSCLRCHGGPADRNVPALFARSTVTAETGEALPRPASETLDETTPFERRWGGWYVTGYEGKPDHRGNAFGRAQGTEIDFSPSAGRPQELSRFFDSSPYPAATSDVVALLIFEHQLTLHNSLARAAQNWRRALDDQHARQKAAGSAATDTADDDQAERVLAGAAEDVLDHLLFRNAAPLPDGVKGSAPFLQAFATDAPRSSHGDALKDLALRGRLFASRCSFLIYSDAFGALPAPLKNRVLDRLAAVLRDEDASGRYAYLERDEKRRISEVLIETHPAARQRFQKLAH